MVTVSPSPVHLPQVRRYEAAGFRAWPAASVHYDGSWLIRLTAGHPGRRLNSINPLDPSDCAKIGERIAKASRRFDAYNRPVTVRISPLAGEQITAFFDREGWLRCAESVVMTADIAGIPTDSAIDHIPMKDIGRFVEALLAVRGSDRSIKAGLSEIIDSIAPDTGLFVLQKDQVPVSTGLCVHDGELAGLFEVATHPDMRRQGFGRDLVLAALRWAKLLGASRAWLQVEADNKEALGLYSGLGFEEIYRYHYRQPPPAEGL